MTPSEVLLKAAEEIEKRGWTQGHLSDLKGRVCAVGAINCAIYGQASPGSEVYLPRDKRNLAFEAESCANKEVDRIMKSPLVRRGLVYYNDSVAKDKRYIIRLFRNAAKRCQ